MMNSLLVSSRRQWWVLFSLALCASMAWGFASPQLNGPDEPHHSIRAVATVRGQIIGSFAPSALGYQMQVRLPLAVCVAVVGDPGECNPTPTPDEAEVDTGEFRHPPPYYALVGIPSLVWSGRNGIYVMRLVSAALGSALIAWAFSSTIESGNRLRVLAILTVVTPIVWFLIAEVNPNGVEIAAAICLWSSSLTAATQRHPSRQVILRCGVALAVLVMSRGISPLYALMALGAAAVIAGQPRRRELIARRDVRLWLAAAAGGTLVTGAWVAVAGFSHNVHRTGHALSSSFRSTGLFLQEAVGDWLDLRVSLPFAVAAYAAIALPIVYAGLATAKAPDRRVVVSLLVIALLLPLTSDTLNLPPIASAWQGRYGLPMLAGVVIAAAHVSRVELSTRLWRGGLTLLAVAHTGAFIVFVRHWVDSSSFSTVLVAANAIAVILIGLTLDRITQAQVAGVRSPEIGRQPNPP